jgi:SAM-dependent methyltransferase
VAQAFHWFDGPRALAEIHRILKSGGGLGLVWNVRNETLPWVHRLTAILDEREGDVPQYRTLEWMTPFKGSGFKGSALFSPLEAGVFEHVQLLTPTKLLDRVASISFIASLPEVERAAVLDQVRELVQSEPAIRGVAEFEMPYRTFTYWCRKS